MPQFPTELFTFDMDSSKIMSHIAQLSLLNVYAFLQVASLDASLTPLVPDGGGLLLSLFLSLSLTVPFTFSLFVYLFLRLFSCLSSLNGMARTGLLLMQCFTPALLRICQPAKYIEKYPTNISKIIICS